jgi:hypothetical protein
MAFKDLTAKAQTYFPKLQIKYKDQSTLMKIMGKIMFFNPSFMTSYVSTFGDTVYFPSEKYIQTNSQGATAVFIHECTHMYDEKRVNTLLYSLAYAFPQFLSLLVLPLLFVMSWKIVLPLSLLLLAPLPAPWRTHFEKRAYFVQMYADYKLYGDDPVTIGINHEHSFTNGDYYWMWPFGLSKQFAQEAANIKAGTSEVDTDAKLGAMVKDLVAAAKL